MSNALYDIESLDYILFDDSKYVYLYVTF